MRIIHKGLILILGPLIPAVLVIAFLFNAVQQTYSHSLEENRQIRLSVNSLQHLLTYNDIIIRMYLIWMQQDTVAAKARIREDVARWDELQVEARMLDPQGTTETPITKGCATMMDQLQSSFQEVGDAKKQKAMLMSRLSLLVFFLRQQAPFEVRVLQKVHPAVHKTLIDIDLRKQEQQKAFERQRNILLAGIAASALGWLVLAWRLNADVSRRINILADNMHRFSRGQALSPPVDGTDEIAEFDRGFHSAAELLQSAMAKEKALFESASDIICITDSNLCITAVNPAWERMLGYSDESSVGKQLISFVAADDRQRTKNFVESLKGDTSASVCDIRLIKSDGAVIDLMWSFYWSALDMALYGIASDISDRKRVQNAKEEFLATVSHDLRAPLSSIRSSMEMVLQKYSGVLVPELTRQVSVVISNTGRMLGLLDDLLDLDRFRSTDSKLTKDWVGVNEVVRRGVDETESLAKQKQLTVKVECEPFEFLLDEDRLVQVIVNLLSNAIKYSPVGGTITIDCKNESSHLQLSVMDQGPGVPTGDRGTIFDRFKQARSSDSQTGSGLGLSICKSIVENHGGKIWVEDGENGGCRFVFTLPANQADNSAPKIQRSTVPTPGPPSVVSAEVVRLRSKRSALSWFTDLRLIHKVAIIVSVPIVVELGFAGWLYSSLTQAAQEQQHQLSYHQVIGAFEDTMASTLVVALAIMSPDVPSEQAWAAFKEGLEYNQQAKTTLKDMIARMPAMSEAVIDVSKLDESFKPFIERITFLHAAYNGAARMWTGSNTDRMPLLPLYQKILDTNDKIMAETRNDAAVVDRNLSSLKTRQQQILLGGLAATVLMCLLSVLVFARGIAARLSITAYNVRRVVAGKPLEKSLSGQDEVAQLDHTLHAMAASLNEIRHKEQSVFDNSQDIMCALSKKLEVLRINRAAKTLLGYTADELSGRPLHELMPADIASDAVSTFAKACEQDTTGTFECPVLRKDGTICEILWSLAWSESEQALIVIGHDISGRKELERLKQEFFAMVSHDMRTPISSISHTIDMITQQTLGPCPQEMLPYMRIVARSCDRLLTLINDLLDLERLAAGQMPLNMKSVSAIDILRGSQDALVGLAGEKGISVKIVSKEDLAVYGDPDRLVQVAVNLLSNAIKFSPKDSTIELAVESAGQSVKFLFRDAGCGVAESQQTLIFERYVHLAQAGAKRSDSKGLGLAICKKIVEQHGGTMGVSSKLGHGSTFYFSIPNSPVKAAVN